MDAMGRPCLICQPSSRTGENPPYGMIGGDGGNVGIIRSPLRATVPPDCGVRWATGVPTATGLKPTDPELARVVTTAVDQDGGSLSSSLTDSAALVGGATKA